MWEELEKRVRANEAKGRVSLRRELWNIFRTSGLKPGKGSTNYAVSFVLTDQSVLVWEVRGSASNIFLETKFKNTVEELSFSCAVVPYDSSKQDGGRFSALSREWSFGTTDCIKVQISKVDELESLLEGLSGRLGSLVLNDDIVDAWIERIKSFFPNLRRFDQPDPDFDALERNYKIEFAERLRIATKEADASTDYIGVFIAEAGKQSGSNSYNLVMWRTFDALQNHASKGSLNRVIGEFLKEARNESVSDEVLFEFMRKIKNAWYEHDSYTWDNARQIAEAFAFHLVPEKAIFFRRTPLDALYLESTGRKFPRIEDAGDEYKEELRFARAVFEALVKRDMAPRDLVDVQSALWVISNYKSESGKSPGMQDKLSRAAIEKAMDAYEKYLSDGSDGDFFARFGDPKEYWVRSSKLRSRAVFPTKPIVGYVLEKTDLNSGWAQQGDAAARLHNAGYVIVDEENKPVRPPDSNSHLLKDADRIRSCALNYYIAPARESGEQSISLRAGDLANDIFLAQRMANVCQALKGRKFQELASVAAPQQNGADESTATIFTYDLISQREEPNLSENLILYGPPGTGKTYTTRWEAVRICKGLDFANSLAGPENRQQLKLEYEALAKSGQVEFVTFHQSLSYEEFVEGLRPTTSDPEQVAISDDTHSGSGFRLAVEDGVFKRFSERARLDLGAADLEDHLNRDKDFFRLAVTEEEFERAIAEDQIDWAHGGDIDWSDSKYEDWESVRERRQVDEPQIKGFDRKVYGTWVWRHNAAVDDFVLLTIGQRRLVAIGRIAGEYSFEPPQLDATARHLRAIEWLWKDAAGVSWSDFYGKGISNFNTTNVLNKDEIEWDALDRLVFGDISGPSVDQRRQFVLIIDEINRANISKVFGELITLLETDKRLGNDEEIRLTLPYSKKAFGVPANLHIIGTMNTADRSIALLDTALRRRFKFRELMPEPERLQQDVEGINIRKFLTTLNDRIEYLFDREHQIGHAYFIKCRTRAQIDSALRDSVIPLLKEYFFEDWSRVATVLEGKVVSEGEELNGRFISGRRLELDGLGMDQDSFEIPLRWTVNKTFDFADFEA